MADWQVWAVGLVISVLVLEMVLYAFWRKQLYEDYLAYHNHKVIPHVPESWRKLDSLYGSRIDFSLEWEMFNVRLVPAMGPDLIRKLKVQRAIVLCLYLPVAGLVLWAFADRYILGHG